MCKGKRFAGKLVSQGGCVAGTSKTNVKTRTLKGSPTQIQTTTCTSSLLDARCNKIKQIQTRNRSGCPEGAQNPVLSEGRARFPT